MKTLLMPMDTLETMIGKLGFALICLKQYFNVGETQKMIDEVLSGIQLGNATPDQIKHYATLDSTINTYSRLILHTNEALGLAELAKKDGPEDKKYAIDEITKTLISIQEFMVGQSLNGKDDDNNAIITLSISGGYLSGYTEKLLEAYKLYAGQRNFDHEIIDIEPTKRVIKIEGPKAYGFFKGEHGQHRFIYSALSSTRTKEKDKTQTGFVNVIVEPEIEDTPLELYKDDLKYEFFSASTKGGQHANKTETGVRITHIPTGIQSVANSRSREMNIKAAYNVLHARVAAHYQREREGHSELNRNGDSTEKHIRTYRFNGGNYIRDERTNYKTLDPDSFFKGNLEPFIMRFLGVNFEI